MLDFDLRKKKLSEIVCRCFGIKDVKIIRIDDQCGSSIYEDFDYIVVSPETLLMAQKINQLREKRKLKTIKISMIEYQMAQDNDRISSTRITEGKIDRHGRILTNI